MTVVFTNIERLEKTGKCPADLQFATKTTDGALPVEFSSCEQSIVFYSHVMAIIHPGEHAAMQPSSGEGMSSSMDPQLERQVETIRT
ncbi:hypothetical protein NQ317_010305 [Molorchus minor]|uniref:Uncharacterized protein n=1 Tax=Molorchus minor TaxID=1323400 RepID=A0ABQ9JLH5_9CUCU|nr:hypothetical protein NQ317_010305 [Molorchus minor]